MWVMTRPLSCRDLRKPPITPENGACRKVAHFCSLKSCAPAVITDGLRRPLLLRLSTNRGYTRLRPKYAMRKNRFDFFQGLLLGGRLGGNPWSACDRLRVASRLGAPGWLHACGDPTTSVVPDESSGGPSNQLAGL
jgi:hypothetical protein